MGRPRVGGGNDDRRIVLDASAIQQMFAHGLTAKEMATALGCSTHPVKKAMRRLGLCRPAAPRKGVNAGARNAAWSGGRRVRSDGYVMRWTPSGEVLEHRLVMAEHLGRELKDEEIVHHVDGNRQNNDPANLQVMTQSEHTALHAPEMHHARYGGNHA